MAEYINKEQLLSHLFNKQDEPLDVMKEIAEFHAADVAEVGHGKWVKIAGMAPPEAHGLHGCSLCGGLALQRNLKEELSDFCPHCGADMREVEHESPQI